MTHRIQRRTQRRVDLWALINATLEAALDNLDANLPGLPAGGNTGSTISSRDVSDPTQRIALGHDPALADWKRIQQIDTELHHYANLEKELLGLVTKWGYRTGEAQRHHTKLATTTRDDFCTSCMRIGQCVVRSRRTLCRWCDDYERANKVLPTVELLEKRHQGRRITDADVRAARLRGKR